MKKKLIAVLGLTGVMLPFCMGCGEKTTATITLVQDKITIDGTGATSDGNTITITSGGSYKISGAVSDGQIKIDTENETDKVELILNGVELANSKECAIYEKQAGHVTITLAEGSKNMITSGEKGMYEEALENVKVAEETTVNTTDSVTNAEAEKSATENTEETNASEAESNVGNEDSQQASVVTKAAIFIKDGLTIDGKGSMEVNGYQNNGIQVKGDLDVQSGNLTVVASNNGIKGSDNVVISDGTVTTTTVGDGISAKDNMTIKDGTFTIKTGEGAGETKSMGDATEGQTRDGKNRGQKMEFFNRTEDTSEASGISQKGIKCGKTLEIKEGTFLFDTVDDAVHSNDTIVIEDGKLELATGDDGIHADNSLTIHDGTVNITQSYEGLEATEIVINDGDIDIVASDDGLNASGGDSGFEMGGFPGGRAKFNSNSTTIDNKNAETNTNGEETNNNKEETNAENTDTEVEVTTEKAEPKITINGGDVYINADGDGIDSNQSIYINGGNIYVNGSANGGNSAIDIGTENSGICQINGGTVVGIGYSTMAEEMDASSTQCSFLYVFDSIVEVGTEITIANGDGKEVATITTVKGCDSIIYSGKELSKGETYKISAGEQSGEITLEESYTTNSTSTGMMGMFGGHMKPNNSEDGTAQDGEMPEMPNGEVSNGETSQTQKDETADGQKNLKNQ